MIWKQPIFKLDLNPAPVNYEMTERKQVRKSSGCEIGGQSLPALLAVSLISVGCIQKQAGHYWALW